MCVCVCKTWTIDVYIYASIIHVYDRERIKQISGWLQKCWDPFEICSGLSLAFAVLSRAWRFPPGHFWIFILCGCTGHFVFKWTAVKKKKKDEYNNLLKLSRRERKDSSGVFWSMSFLHLGPERQGASVDTLPRNKKDGLDLAPSRYKSWTIYQQLWYIRSFIFPCTLWF